MNEESKLFVVSVIAVIIKEDKILIMKRSKNKKVAPGIWETLSGRLSVNESPREALLREIKEESNLEVNLDESPYDLYMTTYGDKPMLSLIYKAYYQSGEVKLSEEHEEFSWATLEEFSNKTTLKKLLNAVLKVRPFLSTHKSD